MYSTYRIKYFVNKPEMVSYKECVDDESILITKFLQILIAQWYDSRIILLYLHRYLHVYINIQNFYYVPNRYKFRSESKSSENNIHMIKYS